MKAIQSFFSVENFKLAFVFRTAWLHGANIHIVYFDPYEKL